MECDILPGQPLLVSRVTWYLTDELFDSTTTRRPAQAAQVAFGRRVRWPGSDTPAINRRHTNAAAVDMQGRVRSSPLVEHLAVQAATNRRRAAVERRDIQFLFDDVCIGRIQRRQRAVEYRSAGCIRQRLRASPGDFARAVGAAQFARAEYAPADLRRRFAEYDALPYFIHHAPAVVAAVA